MRTLFILIAISVLSLWSEAQEVKGELKLDRTVREWKMLQSSPAILIEYKFVDCDPSIGYDQENVFLKITNTSDKKVQIDWFADLYYNGVCKTCDYPQEYHYYLVLEPNQEISGNCSLESDHRVTIFSRFLDSRYTGGSQLTDFKLRDLKITPIN